MAESAQVPPVITQSQPETPPTPPLAPVRTPPRRPNILILVVAMVSLILTSFGIVSYLLSNNQNHEGEVAQELTPTPTISKPATTATPTNPNPTATQSAQLQIISTEKTSPGGDYTISEKLVGDTQIITLNYKDQVLVEDIVVKNEKAIGYGTKFGCQCGTSFKGWVSNTSFLIKIVNGISEEYEYLVDATTGLVDPVSFRKIK